MYIKREVAELVLKEYALYTFITLSLQGINKSHAWSTGYKQMSLYSIVGK